MMPSPCLHFRLSPFGFFGHHLIYSKRQHSLSHHHNHSESAPRLVYILIKTGARAILAIPTTDLAPGLAPKTLPEHLSKTLHYIMLCPQIASQSHGRDEVKLYLRSLMYFVLILKNDFCLLFTSKMEFRSFLDPVRKSSPMHNIINPVKTGY